MVVKFITFEHKHNKPKGSIGSTRIRARWLIDKWDEASEWQHGQYADVMIFQKVYWKEMMKDFNGIKILDLCDADWMPGDVNIVEVCGMVDAITCSTKELSEFIRQFVKDKPVVTIPDRINIDVFPKQKEHTEKAKYVVWFGYYHNAKVMLPRVLSSLKMNKLSLVVVSNDDFEVVKDYGVEIINRRWDETNWMNDILYGDFTINPQAITERFKYKSNNKSLISWALGLPVADTADEMRLFIDPEKRNTEKKRRNKELREKWLVDESINQYKDLICNIVKKKKDK